MEKLTHSLEATVDRASAAKALHLLSQLDDRIPLRLSATVRELVQQYKNGSNLVEPDPVAHGWNSLLKQFEHELTDLEKNELMIKNYDLYTELVSTHTYVNA